MILSSYALAGFIVRAFMHRLATRFTEAGVLSGSLFLAALAYVAVPALTDGAFLACAAVRARALRSGRRSRLTIILTYNHAPGVARAEALGMRLMANKVTQIAVPLVFGGLGALGAAPVFLSTGVFLLAGGRAVAARASQSGVNFIRMAEPGSRMSNQGRLMRADQNELLTRTGPGTPLGQLFRRYWLPGPARLRACGARLRAGAGEAAFRAADRLAR